MKLPQSASRMSVVFFVVLGFWLPAAYTQELEYSPYDGRPVTVLWDDGWNTEVIVDSRTIESGTPTTAEIVPKPMAERNDSGTEDSSSKMDQSVATQPDSMAQYIEASTKAQVEAGEEAQATNEAIAQLTSTIERQESLLKELKEARASNIVEMLDEQKEMMAQIKAAQDTLLQRTAEETASDTGDEDGASSEKMATQLSEILTELVAMKQSIATNDQHMSTLVEHQADLASEIQELSDNMSGLTLNEPGDHHAKAETESQRTDNPVPSKRDVGERSPAPGTANDTHQEQLQSTSPGESQPKDSTTQTKVPAGEDTLRTMFERLRERSKELDE